MFLKYISFLSSVLACRCGCALVHMDVSADREIQMQCLTESLFALIPLFFFPEVVHDVAY